MSSREEMILDVTPKHRELYEDIRIGAALDDMCRASRRAGNYAVRKLAENMTVAEATELREDIRSRGHSIEDFLTPCVNF